MTTDEDTFAMVRYRNMGESSDSSFDPFDSASDSGREDSDLSSGSSSSCCCVGAGGRGRGRRRRRGRRRGRGRGRRGSGDGGGGGVEEEGAAEGEGEEEDGDGDDRLFNRHVFESITHTVVEMQKSMRSMNLDMERTHEAMRGVTHRLKVQGQIVHALHRSMNVLEKRACLFGPPSAPAPAATAATASAGAATAVTNAPPGTAPAAYTVPWPPPPQSPRWRGAAALPRTASCCSSAMAAAPPRERAHPRRLAHAHAHANGRACSPPAVARCASFSHPLATALAAARVRSPPTGTRSSPFVPGTNASRPTPCGATPPRSAAAATTRPPTSCSAAARSKRLAALGKRLLRAAQRGRAERARRLLKAGAEVNFAGAGGRWTALHRAAAEGHAPVVQLLLKAGANVNARTAYGFSPLHLSAFNDLSGRCVALLVRAGADLDVWNRSGRTPLHHAAEAGNTAAVRVLVAAGASKYVKNNDGRTPFDVARSVRVRRHLLARAPRHRALSCGARRN